MASLNDAGAMPPVLITTPTGAIVPLAIDRNDLVLELRAALQVLPSTCQYSAYVFQFEGQVCNEYHEIGDRVNLTMVEVDYTLATMHHHVERAAVLLQDPPRNMSVQNWMAGLKSEDASSSESSSIQPTEIEALRLEKIAEFSNSQTVATNKSTTTVSIRKSPFDPPLPYRRLQGDLVYLEIYFGGAIPSVLYVTGHAGGFYVNNSSMSVPSMFDPSSRLKRALRVTTLLELLEKANASFRNWFTSVTTDPSPIHPFSIAQTPLKTYNWIEQEIPVNRESPIRFDAVRIDRSWNEEFLVWNELPEDNADNRLIKYRNQFKVYTEFVAAATAGAVQICDGVIPALNLNEPREAHVFTYNSIFFSFANDSRGIYKDCGGDATAHKIAGNDLRGTALINAIPSSLHTIMTIVVDYRGHRIQCQGLIPGILQGESCSKILFGSIEAASPTESASLLYTSNEDLASTYAAAANVEPDSDFNNKLQVIADRLHWSSSSTVDPCGNAMKDIRLAMDSKAIMASDQRVYLMDLIRTTPRDANYPVYSTHPAATFRPELMERWCQNTALQSIISQSVEGRPTSITQDQIIERAASFRFNINCFTPYQGDNTDDDQKVIKSIASFVIDSVIPDICRAMLSLSVFVIDSTTLTALFHSRGLNMRYLGRVVSLLKTDPSIPLSSLFASICVCEVIIRCAKHALNARLKQSSASNLSSTVSLFFTALLCSGASDQKSNRARLWATVQQLALDRFGLHLDDEFLLSLSDSSRISILRGVCRSVGIVMRNKTYEFRGSFSAQDVLDLHPRVKAHLPDGINSSAIMQYARQKLSQNLVSEAFDAVVQSCQLLCSITGPMTLDVAVSFGTVAFLSYRSGDLALALDQSIRNVLVCQMSLGIDHAETGRAHMQHAMYLLCVQAYDMAWRHAETAANIFHLLGGPNHPDSATALLNLGAILVDQGMPERAIQYQLEGLSRLELAFGKDAELLHSNVAIACHAVAYSHAILGRYRDAIAYEKRCRLFYQQCGPETAKQLADCNSWLSLFTRSAVQSLKKIIPAMTMKSTAAALTWISGNHSSMISSVADMQVDDSFTMLSTNYENLISESPPTSSPMALQTPDTVVSSAAEDLPLPVQNVSTKDCSLVQDISEKTNEISLSETRSRSEEDGASNVEIDSVDCNSTEWSEPVKSKRTRRHEDRQRKISTVPN